MIRMMKMKGKICVLVLMIVLLVISCIAVCGIDSLESSAIGNYYVDPGNGNIIKLTSSVKSSITPDHRRLAFDDGKSGVDGKIIFEDDKIRVGRLGNEVYHKVPDNYQSKYHTISELYIPTEKQTVVLKRTNSLTLQDNDLFNPEKVKIRLNEDGYLVKSSEGGYKLSSSDEIQSIINGGIDGKPFLNSVKYVEYYDYGNKRIEIMEINKNREISVLAPIIVSNVGDSKFKTQPVQQSQQTNTNLPDNFQTQIGQYKYNEITLSSGAKIYQSKDGKYYDTSGNEVNSAGKRTGAPSVQKQAFIDKFTSNNQLKQNINSEKNEEKGWISSDRNTFLTQKEYDEWSADLGKEAMKGFTQGTRPKDIPPGDQSYQLTIKVAGTESTKYGSEQYLQGLKDKYKDQSGVTMGSIQKVPEYTAKNAKLGMPLTQIKGDIPKHLVISTDNYGKIIKIENTKTHTTRELKQGIEITYVKDGPMTLKLGDDVVTISDPKESKITYVNINKNTFNALNALNKEMGGNLGKVTVNEHYAQTGNTRAYAYTSNGKPATAVQTLIDPKEGTWSKMEIRRQIKVNGKPEDEYIKYKGCADCVGSRVGYVHGTSYTAEGRASDNLHTKWIERKTDKVHTITNMEWNSTKNMYKITSFGPEGSQIQLTNVYGKTGFWGTTNLYTEVEGKLVEVVYNTDKKQLETKDGKTVIASDVNKEQYNQMKDDRRKAQHGSDWNWFGDILGKFGSATAGYTGISLLYDEPDPIIERARSNN